MPVVLFMIDRTTVKSKKNRDLAKDVNDDTLTVLGNNVANRL